MNSISPKSDRGSQRLRGCYELVGWIALLAKTRQARRKPQGMAGPCSRLTTQHGAVFAATHLGRGRFSGSPRHSSLQYARYSALLPPWPRENPLPSLPPHKFITASRGKTALGRPPAGRPRQRPAPHRSRIWTSNIDHVFSAWSNQPVCGSCYFYVMEVFAGLSRAASTTATLEGFEWFCVFYRPLLSSKLRAQPT